MALIVSAVLHGGALGFFWVSASRAATVPPLKVYAVNIVSPPPRELGPVTPEQAAPEPSPISEPDPAPEPVPPAPTPEPQPSPAPPPPAPREPSPAPRPTNTPEPRPAPRQTPPQQPTPSRETPRTAANQTRPTPPAENRPAPRPTSPEAEPRRTETAARNPAPSPSTGPAPDASSAGGENLNVRIEGPEFVDPAYLANIQRQVNRYFRRPADARTDEAEVRFWINRDGSVSSIEVVRSAGSFGFRAAAMEAVEQAGINRAFGPLPRAYPADRLVISFYFRPAR